MNKKKTLISLALVVAGILLLLLPEHKQGKQYFCHQGEVFGTYYNIQYEADENLETAITQRLQEFDGSLSMFNDTSVISRINRNEKTLTDSLFSNMLTTSIEVSRLSNGAFDITVAPLVHLWGFGKNRKYCAQDIDSVTRQQEIDSILSFVGYTRIHLIGLRLTKDDPRTTLDASAIAKGYGCDVIANLLRSHGCTNMLIDIGGEMVADGVNSKGKPWTIGISKPSDDPTGMRHELQDTIHTTCIRMATSGNYRQFYYEGNQRRSHTIDPRTGYPVQHSLLSATVTASSCMRADALATACMVLGVDSALRMIEITDDAACYLIIGDGDSLSIATSSRWGTN